MLAENNDISYRCYRQQQRYHRNRYHQNRNQSEPKRWRHSPMLSLCLVLFFLITGFSLSMLILTQILLSASSNLDANTLLFGSYSDTNVNDDGAGSQWRRPSSLPFLVDYLANVTGNGTMLIDDRMLSLRSNDLEDDDDDEVSWSSPADDNGDRWQPVRSSANKFFIFSAYVDSYDRSNMIAVNVFGPDDNRKPEQRDDRKYFVRIIAVTILATKDKIVCVFTRIGQQRRQQRWFREGKMKPIREHWNLKYSAFFLYCPLPANTIGTGQLGLSILALSQQLWRLDRLANHLNDAQIMQTIVPSNQLPIHETVAAAAPAPEPPNRKKKNKTAFAGAEEKLAVCIKPLHYHYNKTISLMEFVELNRLLGADRFYFYNHTVDGQVSLLLSRYRVREPGLIYLLQWALPIRSQVDIRTEGIFASLNDCLYRARSDRYHYVIFIDLDEFIVPNRHENLLDLIRDVQRLYPEKVGAYSFRNGFFYLQYADDDDERRRRQRKWPPAAIVRHLVTIQKTRRKAELNVHKQRSKCIVDVRYTIEMGNHFVWELTQGKHTLNVDATIAYLHHYRTCEFGGDDCVQKTGNVVDQRLHHWAERLIGNVRLVAGDFCRHQPITAAIANPIAEWCPRDSGFNSTFNY